MHNLEWEVIKHDSDFAILWEVRWNNRFWFFNNEAKATDFLNYWKFN